MTNKSHKPIVARRDSYFNILHVKHIFNVGDVVFDMPSQALATVTAREFGIDAPADGDATMTVFYIVDAPPDPTGDGAFAGGSRCEHEVCVATETLPLAY